MTRTIQLRRYEISPELLDDFLEWWHTLLVPARLAHGFTIEFGYVDREASVFTWAVSLPVDAEEFARRDEEWLVSPERMAALHGTPQRVHTMHNTVVERIG